MPTRKARWARRMAQRITLTVSVRMLAVSVVIIAGIFGFLIYGAYQGIAANHNTLDTRHAQRIEKDKAIQSQIDASFCDVVYFFDGQGVKDAPFLEHVRQVHHCDAATVHPAPKGAKPVPPSKRPVAKIGLGGSPTGSSGGGQAGTSGQGRSQGGISQGTSGTPRTPTPSPSHTPTPPRTTSPPPNPLGPVISPVCKLLDPVLGGCILLP